MYIAFDFLVPTEEVTGLVKFIHDVDWNVSTGWVNYQYQHPAYSPQMAEMYLN